MEERGVTQQNAIPNVCCVIKNAGVSYWSHEMCTTFRLTTHYFTPLCLHGVRVHL